MTKNEAKPRYRMKSPNPSDNSELVLALRTWNKFNCEGFYKGDPAPQHVVRLLCLFLALIRGFEGSISIQPL